MTCAKHPEKKLMLIGLVLFGACGAPSQQVDAGVTNRPPRILSNAPALRSNWYVSTRCPSLNPRFTLSVEDQDGDRLRSLWFIDDPRRSPAFSPSPTGGGASAQEVAPPGYVGFTSAMANLSTGVHVLSVYVADSDFLEPYPSIDGGTGIGRADGFVDSFSWVLDAKPCP